MYEFMQESEKRLVIYMDLIPSSVHLTSINLSSYKKLNLFFLNALKMTAVFYTAF